MIPRLERNFQNDFNHPFGTFEHVSDQNWVYEQNDFNLDQCAASSKVGPGQYACAPSYKRFVSVVVCPDFGTFRTYLKDFDHILVWNEAILIFTHSKGILNLSNLAWYQILKDFDQSQSKMKNFRLNLPFTLFSTILWWLWVINNMLHGYFETFSTISPYPSLKWSQRIFDQTYISLYCLEYGGECGWQLICLSLCLGKASFVVLAVMFGLNY